MTNEGGLAGKLSYVMKALNLTNGRVASELGVNKSVVARWLNGATLPSAHNMARLSTMVGARVPGFSRLDWESSLAELQTRLRRPGDSLPPGLGDWLGRMQMGEAAAATAAVADSVSGLWRSLRPLPRASGYFARDAMMIWPGPAGPVEFVMGAGGFRLHGWATARGNQFYCCVLDGQGGFFSFAIANFARVPRVDLMDGVTIAAAIDGAGAPFATAYLLERVGDLTGDHDADLARFEELMQADALIEERLLPPELVAHLLPNAGLSERERGNEPALMMEWLRSLARGVNAASKPPNRVT